MMRRNTASKASTFMPIIIVAIVAVSTTFSDAFVPQPSVANVGAPKQVQQNDYLTNSRRNDQTSCLFVSTPSKSENELMVIDSWQLLPDGRIKGIVAESGDSVLTSPLKKKSGLKEKTTVRTLSGSRYKLGTPASVVGAGNNLSADRLGVPRATLGGINGNANSVRATQPLKSSSTASRDGLMENFLANKGRATMPLQSDSLGSPSVSSDEIGAEKKYDLLTPLIGGGSALAIGAAIGTGVVNDKGVDLSKLKNVPDPSEVLESVKSLDLPDIKSLKAPNIPSAGVSFPKFEGLPSISAPQLPDVNLPDALDLKLPKGIKMPNVAPINVPIPDGMKNLGDAATGALDGVFSKKTQVTSVGQGAYRVPMPYLDQRIVQAEKERRAQEAAEKALAAEIEEAARMQKLREEEAAKIQKIRAETEAEFIARQNIEREEEAQRRAEIEARIQREADGRVKVAEDEAATLRSEVEKARLEAAEREKAAVDEATRLKKEVESALLKEQAAAEEAALLKKEAEAARLKEQAAKEEFTRKLEQAELVKLKDAQAFALKLAEAEEAAARGRALEEESLARQKLADEAAARQVVATAEVRKASIGASAARKASYPSPSLSTYQAWQERQRNAYRMRMESVAEYKESAGVVSDSSSSSSQDNLSTYKKWQQNVAAKQITSMSAEPVKAAYITGSPPPVVNQLVSGLTKISDATKPSDTTKLSDAAIALNGKLGYTIAGTSAVLGGITYANEYYKIQDELSRRKEIEEASKTSLGSTSRTSVTEPPLPPVAPQSPRVQESISATKAIDANPYPRSESASATKEVLPPPPSRKPVGSLANPTGPSGIPTTEAAKQTTSTSKAPSVESNEIRSESMPRSDDNVPPKSSYSPFASAKKTSRKDSLYDPPLMQEDNFFDSPSVDSTTDLNTESQYGATDTPFSSQNGEKLVQPASDESLTSSPSGTVLDTASSQSNGASYLQSISEPKESVNESPKKSYSPFSSGKTFQEKGNLLYDPSIPSTVEQSEPPTIEESANEYSMTQLPEVTTINQVSYLDKLNGSPKSNLKKSYAPFGTKPKAVGDNEFYSSEKNQVNPLHNPFEPANNPVQKQERNATFVSNYLEQLIAPLNVAPSVGKKSFSPSGSQVEKPWGQTTGSEILYRPPSESSILKYDLVSEEKRNVTPGASYLEQLVVPVSVSSSVGKKSFAPFGSGEKPKPQTSGSNVLYRPPSKSSMLKYDLVSEVKRVEELPPNLDAGCTLKSPEENDFVHLPESRQQASFPTIPDNHHSRKSSNKVHEDVIDTGETSALDSLTLKSDKIRTAYQEWCNSFKKEPNDFRFEIFSTNYKAAKKFHEEHGTPLMLNEFSDLTEVEYNSTSNEFIDDISSANDSSVVEERIISAYKQWCAWYKKDFSQDRLQIFASNFLLLERYNRGLPGTSSMCFNEFSDLTEEEFNGLK